MRRGILALVAIVLASLALPSTASADTTASTTVANNYPNNIEFSLTATSDVEITEAVLNYRIAGRNTSARGIPETFNPGTNISAEVRVSTGSSSSYIPAGSEFTYSWELDLADGTTYNSPDETFLYMPPGNEWEFVGDDTIRVYFHGDRASIAEEYLEAGQETYERIAVDLLNTELTQLPVKVILFAEESDLEVARPGGSSTLDAAVTNCGTKVTSDIVFVIHRSCGTADRTDTLRHEFGHIINEAAGESPLGIIPSWLDEGTAVHAQSEPGDGYLGAYDAAVRSNRLIPFVQMATPSSSAGTVNLFYGQAFAMTDFLIERDGPEQFAEFFATIKAGNRFDQALEMVYGFDLAGFEREFYEANGLGDPAAPPPTQQQGQQANPTPASTRPPLQTTGTSDDDDGIDRVAIAAIGAAVLFGLLAVFFYLMSAMMASSRRQPAGPPPEAGDDDWRPPPPPNP